MSTTVDGLDVLAEGCYFLALPSAHPDGGLYYSETLPPIFTLPSLSTLDWLNLEPALPPRPRRWLPDLVWRILTADRETLSRYATRSEAEAAFCASLARAGFQFSDALALLRSYPGPGKFAEMDTDNLRNAMRYLGLTWHKAGLWIAEHDNAAGTPSPVVCVSGHSLVCGLVALVALTALCTLLTWTSWNVVGATLTAHRYASLQKWQALGGKQHPAQTGDLLTLTC